MSNVKSNVKIEFVSKDPVGTHHLNKEWNLQVSIGDHIKDKIFKHPLSPSDLLKESEKFLRKLFGNLVVDQYPYFHFYEASEEFQPHLALFTQSKGSRTLYTCYLTSKDMQQKGILIYNGDMEEEMIDLVFSTLSLVYEEELVQDLMKVFKEK